MLKKIRDYFIKTLLPALCTSFIILCVIAPVGCTSITEGLELIHFDNIAPQLLKIDSISAEKIQLTFNKKVVVKDCVLKDAAFMDEDEIKVTSSSHEDNPAVFDMIFDRSTVIGKKYIFEGVVEDLHGNSLTFSFPFNGYNDNVCHLVFSEICNAANAKSNHYEFIELYALSGGNTSGVEVVSGGDGEDKKYVLPPCNVKKGEYITIHLRKMKNEDGSYVMEGMNDETGNDLTLSRAVDSCDSGRDLWVENTQSRISSSDILVLRDTNKGEVMDAFICTTSKFSSWAKKFSGIADEVSSSGMWVNSDGEVDTEHGVESDAMTTVNRSFSRINVETLPADEKRSGCASDWIITANKSGTKKAAGIAGVTPGYKNSSNEYVPKKN